MRLKHQVPGPAPFTPFRLFFLHFSSCSFIQQTLTRTYYVPPAHCVQPATEIKFPNLKLELLMPVANFIESYRLSKCLSTPLALPQPSAPGLIPHPSPGLLLKGLPPYFQFLSPIPSKSGVPPLFKKSFTRPSLPLERLSKSAQGCSQSGPNHFQSHVVQPHCLHTRQPK